MGNKSLPPKSNKTLLLDFGKNVRHLSHHCSGHHRDCVIYMYSKQY